MDYSEQDLANSLGQPLENALWINTSYFLANAASQTISSMLAEVFGHGPILLAAAVLSTIGTGVCGGSLNLAGIIAGRSLQGTGGGGILAASFLIISNLIPKYHQQEFTNYVFRAQVAGSIVGAILGGLFGDYATTTWPFYSSFVFCALGMLVVPFAVDLRGCGQGNTGYVCKLRRTDWLGALLILFGVGTLLIGISWGGTRFAWDEAATLVPICVGISLLLLLVAYERFWTVHPFFSSAMFKSLSTTMIHISGFIYGTIVRLQTTPSTVNAYELLLTNPADIKPPPLPSSLPHIRQIPPPRSHRPRPRRSCRPHPPLPHPRPKIPPPLASTKPQPLDPPPRLDPRNHLHWLPHNPRLPHPHSGMDHPLPNLRPLPLPPHPLLHPLHVHPPLRPRQRLRLRLRQRPPPQGILEAQDPTDPAPLDPANLGHVHRHPHQRDDHA